MADDELLTQILESHDGLQTAFGRAEEFRLQIVLGLVEEGVDGKPVLEQHTFRTGAEYF